MSRLYSYIVLTAFVVWILPLGVFFKPSQEKLACDGQRAICLCSHLMKKSSEKAVAANSFRAASSSQQKENSSGSSSHQFLLSKPCD